MTAKRLPPNSKPIRNVSTFEDVGKALDEARLFLLEGGSWEHVEEYVNEWLDYGNKVARRKAKVMA